MTTGCSGLLGLREVPRDPEKQRGDTGIASLWIRRVPTRVTADGDGDVRQSDPRRLIQILVDGRDQARILVSLDGGILADSLIRLRTELEDSDGLQPGQVGRIETGQCRKPREHVGPLDGGVIVQSRMRGRGGSVPSRTH